MGAACLTHVYDTTPNLPAPGGRTFNQSEDDMKHCLKEIKTFIMNSIPLLFIITITVLIFFGSIYAFINYAAYDFERRTGLEVECNIAIDCYVKIDGKWIPYQIWKKEQPVTINLRQLP
jgi:hypothetical protein